MKNFRAGRIWLIILGLALLISDYHLSLGSVVFYTPEVVIYLWLIALLVRDRGTCQFSQAFKATPLAWRLAVELVLIGAIVGSIVSPLFPQSLGALKAWFVAPFLFGLIVLREQIDWTELLYLVTALAIGLVVGGLGLYHWSDPSSRLRSIYQSPNYYAQLAVPALAFIYVAWRRLQLNLKLFGPLMIILAVALLLTRSVGGLVGLAVALAGYELLSQKATRWRWVATLAVIIILLVASVVAYQRLSKRNNSLDSRTQIWRSAAVMISRHPLAGVGLRGFEHDYPSVAAELYGQPIDPTAAQPHNLLLSFWVNIGLIGLLGALWLYIQQLRRQAMLNPAWWALVAIFVIGLIDTPYWRPDLTIMFWLYMTALQVKVTTDEAKL